MNSTFIITLAVAVIPSFLMLYVTRKLNKMSKKNDKAQDLRHRESILILENIDAVGTLTEKTAICVKNDRVNGDLDDAFAYRVDRKHAFEMFLREVNAAKSDG